MIRQQIRHTLEGKALGRPCEVIDISEAILLLEEGLSFEEVGERLGVSASTVRRRVKNGGFVAPKEKTSKSGLSETDDSDKGRC